MAKAIFMCIIMLLFSLLIVNSNVFKKPVRAMIVDVLSDNKVRAVTDISGQKPEFFIVTSDKKEGDYVDVYILSTLGNVLCFLIVMVVLTIIFTTTILKPTPFNPYRGDT